MPGPSLLELALIAGGFSAVTILAILNLMARDFEYGVRLARLTAEVHELRERQLERIRALNTRTSRVRSTSRVPEKQAA